MGWIMTRHEGVRYREHPTRKCGRNADRYIVIRYRVNGRRIDEVIGWTSQGASLDRAAEILAALRQNHRTGQGPQTLAEMRTAAAIERTATEILPNTLDDLCTVYMEWAQYNKKSWRDDQKIITTRLCTIKHLPLQAITPVVMERLKQSLSSSYSPASVRHALGMIRRMWNWAAITYGSAWTSAVQQYPLRGIKLPKVSNSRLRYLTRDEVVILLDWCADHDPGLAPVIETALYTGMRRSELAFLQVGHVDLQAGIINIVDPKSGATRETVTLPANLVPLLRDRTLGRPQDAPVFPSVVTGRHITNMSKRFEKAAIGTGINDNLISTRYKATFHVLRHTFCSWLVIAGVDLRTVQEMARHRSFDMTLRYSHLAPRAKRAAADLLAEYGGSRHDPD